MKKKKIILLIIISVLQLFLINYANAVTCRPAWDGNWVATANCSWPQTYDYNTSGDDFKVYGNINIGSKTITLSSGDNLGIDLSTKWIKFTTGKINLSTTSKISNNSASRRYYYKKSYYSGSITNCPDGMKVFYHTDISPVGFVRPSPTSGYYKDNSNKIRQMIHAVASSGRLYCGTIGEYGENTGTSGKYGGNWPGAY